jgi:hypothetical protein
MAYKNQTTIYIIKVPIKSQDWFWLLLCTNRHRSILEAAGHYTDTSESVGGNGAQNMVIVQS